MIAFNDKSSNMSRNVAKTQHYNFSYQHNGEGFFSFVNFYLKDYRVLIGRTHNF